MRSLRATTSSLLQAALSPEVRTAIRAAPADATPSCALSIGVVLSEGYAGFGVGALPDDDADVIVTPSWTRTTRMTYAAADESSGSHGGCFLVVKAPNPYATRRLYPQVRRGRRNPRARRRRSRRRSG